VTAARFSSCSHAGTFVNPEAFNTIVGRSRSIHVAAAPSVARSSVRRDGEAKSRFRAASSARSAVPSFPVPPSTKTRGITGTPG
jgi:hypothetical protein